MAKFIVDAIADGMITLKTPGNNYRNTFKVNAAGPLPAPGEPIHGIILAPAWKVEQVSLGGNYVEPLYGRPRRMQGTVMEVNAAANTLTVKTPYPVVVKLPPRYKAADFPVGSRVGFDNIDIPTFEPQAAPVTQA